MKFKFPLKLLVQRIYFVVNIFFYKKKGSGSSNCKKCFYVLFNSFNNMTPYFQIPIIIGVSLINSIISLKG